jgi:hypothetical protein
MADKAAHRFEQIVKERLTQATNETGYPFAGVYKIVEDKGAVVAAKKPHQSYQHGEGT